MTTASTWPDLPLYGASPLVAYRRYWQRSVVFTGRAGRAEYWWPVLLNVVVGVVIGVLGAVLLIVGGALRQQGAAISALPNALGAVLLLLVVLFTLAQILPSIAVAVRRLHDADLSGLFVLLGLIPSVGGVILLVLAVLPPNPAGRRFDGGPGAWPSEAGPTVSTQESGPPVPTRTMRDARSAPSALIDAPPAPSAPSTAQLPAQEAAHAAGTAVPDAIRTAWQQTGRVEDLSARLSAQPSWRSQGYLLIERPDGIAVLSTHGLGPAEGAAALGPGAEVYLASPALSGLGARAADGWELGVVASVARRVQVSGMHLPAELEQYGALSMTVPAASAPEVLRGPDGSVGVLIGVPLPGAPDTVATPAGEVRLVGLVPLRQEELQRILAGGREARTDIAAALARLSAAQLADPDRPAL